MAKYGLSPQEFPRAAPFGTPLGSGHILPYIPPLLLIWIQYSTTGVFNWNEGGFGNSCHSTTSALDGAENGHEPFSDYWLINSCHKHTKARGRNKNYNCHEKEDDKWDDVNLLPFSSPDADFICHHFLKALLLWGRPQCDPTTMLVMTKIFISKMEGLPPTSDPNIIDFWLILCQLVPFAEVVLLTAMESIREVEVAKKKKRKKPSKGTLKIQMMVASMQLFSR